MSKAAMTALPYTAAFKPTSVPGCQMWLDGADPAGTGVAPANGTTVSSWVDKSGNGNSGTAGGTGAAYSSSQKALLFGSLTATPEAGGQRTFTTGNYYTTPYTAAPANETCFVVFSMPVLGFGFMITSHTCNGRSFGTPLFNGTTASLAGGVICASWGVTAYIPLTTSTIYIGELITSSGNQYGTVNGGTLAGPVAQSYNAGTTTDIGGFIALNGYYFNGYIYEIICYNSVLSTNQRQSVEGYLAWKWGIQSSLPQFVPTSVGGTQLWLDGADITTQTFSGANITAWNDKSGNNYHMNQLTATSGQITGSAAYPTAGTAINGKSTVNFSPQAGLKQSNNLNGVRNLYWVGRISNSGGSGYYFLFGQDTYYDWHANPYSPSNRMLWDLYTSAELRNATASLYTLDANAAVNTTFGNINYTSHSSISILSVSGITGSSSLYQGICYDRNTHVGWCGDLAEVLVYSTALTNTQHQQVEGYLAWKWGMQAQLPITHPYYGAAPTVHPYGAVAPTGPNALGITRAPAVTALVPTVKRAMTSLSYNGAFKPTSITGCSLWLDAADATTITGTTSITAWRDKSGNNNNAIFTGTNPSYVAASNVVITANQNQHFTIPAAAIATSTGTGSLFMVYGDQQTGASYQAAWGTANPGSRFYQQLQGGSDTPYSVNGPFTPSGTIVSALNTTNTILYNMNYTYGSSTGDLRINGKTLSSTYGGTPTPSGALTISGTGWGVVANLRIYEVIICKGTSVLTTSQIQQIEGYLAWKWGLQSSLPQSLAPAFTNPTTIPGCILWLDATDPLGTGVQPANGTTLTTWKDKSPSNFPFTSVGSVYNTTAVNGLPGMTLSTNFIGYDPGSAQNNWQEVFALGLWTGGSTFNSYNGFVTTSVDSDGGAQGGILFIGNAGSTVWWGPGNTYVQQIINGTQTGSAFPAIQTPFIARTFSATAVNLRGLRFGIDRTWTDRIWIGFISEVICYNTTLTASQRLQVEGYLAWKWGSQASLVNTHTYYSATPIHTYVSAAPVGASLRAPAVAALVPTPSKATTATTKPGYLPFYQVTSNDWTTSWLPYLQKLSATNTGATASSTLGTITGTSVGFYVSSFLAPNGLIYLADNANNPMGVITPTANGGTYSSTTVTGVGPATQYGDNYKGGGLASNGIIYLVPFGAPGIGTINTNTNVFTTNPFNVNPGSAAVAGGVSGPDGNIYCAPYVNLSQLFYFTPGANTINSFSISATIRYSKPFLAPNGKIYCLGSTKIVGVIDPIGRTFTEVGTAANQQYGFMVLGGNGVVYAFPQNASGIGTLNLTTNVITANVIAGGTGYYGGILGPDGNIYLYQSGAGNIGVLNTKTNTLSVLTSTSIGYICAVLAPNGNIYLGASSVIVFSGVSLIPTLNFCLTPYLNNGANRF